MFYQQHWLSRISPLGFDDFLPKFANPSPPDSGWREKINWIIIFILLCDASKIFVNVFMAFIKPFEAPQRSIVILIQLSEKHGAGSSYKVRLNLLTFCKKAVLMLRFTGHTQYFKWTMPFCFPEVLLNTTVCSFF